MAWGVGSVAARLGLAASTLRTWERRYDVGPTHRTAGGHRRYTEIDIERVTLMQKLISGGAPPMEAARVAHSLDEAGLMSALSFRDIVDLTVNLDHEQTIDAILRAAGDINSMMVGNLIAGVLRREGVVDAWTSVLAPSLIRIGNEWSQGNLGIEVEHLATECLVAEMRAHTRAQGLLPTASSGLGSAIVLASAEDDLHSLPLIALECALAETGRACHHLGSRLPAHALTNVTTTLRPAVVFLWASLPRNDEDDLWHAITAVPPPTNVILGGPGWPHDVASAGRPPTGDLRSTVDRISELVG